MKILLVENNRDIAESLAHRLKKYNIECDQCYCGNTCLKILENKSNLYDCLLVDNNLDDSSIDGKNLINLIRNNRCISNIPMVFYSGDPSFKKLFVDLLNSGVDDCMTMDQQYVHRDTAQNNFNRQAASPTLYNQSFAHNHNDSIAQFNQNNQKPQALVDDLEYQLNNKTPSINRHLTNFYRNSNRQIKSNANQMFYDMSVKPCTPDQLKLLAARITCVVRRSAGSSSNSIKIGYLNYDLSNGRFDIEGVELRLSSKEAKMLTFLVNRVGQVCSRQEFMEILYGSNWAYHQGDINMKISDVFMCRVRRNIKKVYQEAYPDKPFQKLIVTYWGYGYCIPHPREQDSAQAANKSDKVMNLKYAAQNKQHKPAAAPSLKPIVAGDYENNNNYMGATCAYA